MNRHVDLLRLRLRLQRLSGGEHRRVGDLVSWMGTMQAQELGHALAGVGLRLPHLRVDDVSAAIAAREIVHTWVMRGTLHLVAAADVWWMQQLLGPAVMSRAAGTFLKGGLDEATLQKSYALLSQWLPGAGPVMRRELVRRLADAGIDMRGPLSSRVFTAAAYGGLICLGPLEGKQDTFVWLEDVVARPAEMDRGAAIIQLAQRYFQSHGPASEADFVAWSGLGIREARAGMAELKGLETWAMADTHYHWIPDGLPELPAIPQGILLPGFDEYLIGYRDRSWVLPDSYFGIAVSSNGLFRPLILIDGVARGIWKKSVGKQAITIELSWFEPPREHELMAVRACLPFWEAFWEMPIRLS